MKQTIFINGYIGEMFDFFGDGNSFSLKSLNDIIASMPSDVTEIEVRINSGGGLVSEGFAIHDKLVDTKLPITTIVEGMCGSIATVIAQAGKTGSRKMFQNSEYFIHNPLWIPNSPDAHNADDLQKLTDELRKNEDKLLNFYVNNTGANREVLAEKMKGETTLTAQEAKDFGFVDEIINTDVVAMVKYKIAAAVQLPVKPKNNNMSELKEEVKTGFAKIEGLFAKLLKGKMVNVAQMTADGTTLYSDTDVIAVDTKLFTDEAMTMPVDDGDYIMEDGSTVTVVAGVVTNVVAAQVASDLEIANKKIAELEAQIKAKDSEISAAKSETNEVLNNAAELEKEFVAFKATIQTGVGQSFAAAPVSRDEKTGKYKQDWRAALLEKREKQNPKK